MRQSVSAPGLRTKPHYELILDRSTGQDIIPNNYEILSANKNAGKIYN
ncbi:hypothetical protein IQ269_09010 [Tychonema sp. LEGE 07199]|nr:MULTISPECIES: hypothetical protein [unclassified Tychonema]MBE9120953.1 hypothetical protein [Tychonema sp. LEGE 07199]